MKFFCLLLPVTELQLFPGKLSQFLYPEKLDMVMFDRRRVWQTPKSVQGTDRTAQPQHTQRKRDRRTGTQGQLQLCHFMVGTCQFNWNTLHNFSLSEEYISLPAGPRTRVVQEFLSHIKDLFSASPKIGNNPVYHHWNKPQHIMHA